MPWLKKSVLVKAKLKPGQFRRSELPEKDLAKLALAYMLSGSPELKKAVVVVSRFRDLDISGAPEFNEEVIRMACRVLVTLAEDGSSILDRQRLVRVLEESDAGLPTKRDSLQNPIQVNRVLWDLRIKLQDEFPDIFKAIADNTTSNFWNVFDSVLAHATALLDVIKETLDLSPVPALKPAFAAAVGMLQVVREFRSSYAPLNDLTSTTTKLLLLLAEETDGKKRLSASFQAQVDRLTSSLLMVLEKCERIKNQSLTRKFLFQYADKAALSDALRDLQTAIESFKIASVIKHEADLKALISETHATNKMISELLDVTGSMLLLALQISTSISSVIPDDVYFPHSRDDEIDHIRTWAIKGNGRFLWVQASAAMGKSTLMRHLIDVFEGEGRLATYYFFEPESKIDFLSVAKHMAYEMALLHPKIRIAISKITPLPQNHKLHEHLLHLVLQPLSTLPQDSLIVIDALDQHQCPQELLANLQTALEFAPNVKVVFTARANSDTLLWTSSNDAVETYILPPFDNTKMKEYLQTQFGGISDWIDGCPSEEQVERLVSMAEGHIGWAVYASALISDHKEIPDDMLGNVLDKNPIERLDALYLEILKPLLKNPDRSGKVLGMLLVIEEPLSREALNQLAYTQRLKVDEVYHQLCLLRTRGKEYITPISKHFHSSFLEFLRDEYRCGAKLHPLASADAHLLLFQCSARLLEQSSRPGIDHLLSYAYEWWPHHIVNACRDLEDEYSPFPPDIRYQVKNFISASGPDYIDSQLRKLQIDLPPPDVDIIEQVHWLSSNATWDKRWSKCDKPLATLTHLISLQQVMVRLPSSSVECDKLYILGRLFYDRYLSFWSVDDMDRAIHTYHKAFPLSASHPYRSKLAIELCASLLERHDTTGDLNDLEDAIKFGEEALELCPAPHPDRDVCLNNVATALQYYFRLRGDVQDLFQAIRLHSEALTLRPTPHPSRNMSLNNLAATLQSRFLLQGDARDLEKVIEPDSEALALCPVSHPNRDKSLNSLAIALQSRFLLHGDARDLEKAIELHSEALGLRPAPHPDRCTSLNNLANVLKFRFELQGDARDLDDAIKLHSEALALLSAQHPDRVGFLYNLAAALEARFRLRREAQDLDKAIEHHSEALALCPAPHPRRGISLNELASALRSRFELRGDAQDLDEAIALHLEALRLDPSVHPERYKSLTHLGCALRLRFELHNDRSDLDEAIASHRQALAICSTKHPFRHGALYNLAVDFHTRFKHNLGMASDLSEAVKLLQEAVGLTPVSDPWWKQMNTDLEQCLDLLGRLPSNGDPCV